MNKFKILLFLTMIISLKVFCEERPIIHDLVAYGTDSNKITLSWNLPKNPEPKITKLIIYKNTKPISSYFDIQDATEIATLSSKSVGYADSVQDYTDYYYAVVAETKNGIYKVIAPSINSTVSGTHLRLPKQSDKVQSTASAKEKIYSTNGLRETPLPYLDFINNQDKTPVKLSKKSYEYAKELGSEKKSKKKPFTENYLFEEDLISPDGGDAFLLFEILRTTFMQKKYKEAAEKLEHLIRTNRSKDVTNRAIFYLGETYYFSKDYKTAAKTFLKVYEYYPKLAKKWIDSSLDLYVIPN